MKFRSRIIPALCVIILVPPLAMLGFWQLDRADEKTKRLQLFEQRSSSRPLRVGAQMETPSEMEFRQVTAKGRWDGARQFLLDNQVLRSRAGYHVITPLVLRGGNTAVLVDRGWIPAPLDRSVPPRVEPVTQQDAISGIAIIPDQDPFLLKRQQPIGDQWQYVWQALEIDRYREAVDYQLHDFIIVLDAGHERGFEHDWTMPGDAWIVRHEAYAVQWFALAATVVIIYLAVIIRRRVRLKRNDAQ